MITASEIKVTHKRISPYINNTPIQRSAYLSKLADADVYLKLDCIQKTGSFKFRGAMSKLTSISEMNLNDSAYAASTGNHGAAVSLGAFILGMNSKVIVPENTSPAKLEMIKLYGGSIEFYGTDCLEAESHAQKLVFEKGGTYVSPYNDEAVVRGQGTMGVELSESLANIDSIIVSVGGGGLIGGVGTYLKSVNPGIEIVAASPKNSSVMYESLKAGKVLDLPSQPTLSDGTAGGVEKNSITFPICQKVINKFVLLTEKEIAAGLKVGLLKHHLMMEGAAGTAIAAFLKEINHFKGKKVVIVICGGNISQEVLRQVLI
jgi:threonine dehydratase